MSRLELTWFASSRKSTSLRTFEGSVLQLAAYVLLVSVKGLMYGEIVVVVVVVVVLRRKEKAHCSPNAVKCSVGVCLKAPWSLLALQ